MGNKLTQVSFLFVFATLLVVIGHADITLDYKDLWIHKWVYSFHMPLFFLVSGFLFAYTHPENKMKGMRFFPFIWKKVKRLLLPFLFINSVIFVIKSRFVSADLMQHPLTFSFSSWVESLLFHPIGFMWFLPALFMIFVCFSLLRNWICVNKYLQMGGGNSAICVKPCDTRSVIYANIVRGSLFGLFRLGDSLLYLQGKGGCDSVAL